MDLKRVSFGIMALTLLVSSCSKKQVDKEQELAEYPTMVVKAQTAQLESTYAATIKGQEDIQIMPRVEGYIKSIYVDEGSIVRKGQSLFKIDSPQSQQAYTTAKASLASAQAQVGTAKLNVDRFKALVDKGIVSDVQYQTYLNAYETSKASYDQAKAALVNAEATLSWTDVTSPVDGIVGSIPFRQGSLVNSSSTLTTIANTKNVYVYFSMNEKELMELFQNLEGADHKVKLQNIPDASLILANGTKYSLNGKVSTVTGQVNVTTGTVNFRADFPNPNGELKSGFSGKVIIPDYVENTFVIPQKATFQQQNKRLVYKVQGDSVVQTLVSVLPMPDGKSFAVTSGLNEGDKIVSDGIVTLSNGKKIIAK